ncbi:ABC transporter permease, partial [Bifidobacterium amazonense]
GVPVSQLISQRLSNTLIISGLSIAVSFAGAFVIAFFAACTRHDWVRDLLNMLPTLGVSVPSFWIGLLLMQVFSFGLGLLPSVGTDGWQTLILPTVTMSIPMMALLSRLLMTGFEEVLREGFITTAKAHGLSYRTIVVTHVLRNGSLPAFTMLGLIIGHTVTGAIVAETVFSRQGVGMLVQQSVENQDIPVVQGVVLLAAAAFVVINLIVDLVYPLLDPRISHVRGKAEQ